MRACGETTAWPGLAEPTYYLLPSLGCRVLLTIKGPIHPIRSDDDDDHERLVLDSFPAPPFLRACVPAFDLPFVRTFAWPTVTDAADGGAAARPGG